ncbi:hypothetical protein [Amycolatopsis sp. BJA-103]|uniref:hypothetical protein n=1 Tax=Amycolatopsis sp. BJA-103 TaxID=1911175 RepID=UPI000C78C292|nr:hypothetical protein [Amycolatopsis sp. BJA-103]AUI57315.1 hypothetical protein BKN51_03195 [Amycolatopsis sp. BJA-103]PNE13256.1 hypothetical protein B1H26_41435 [Amycolatopsis sp. BJA-103]
MPIRYFTERPPVIQGLEWTGSNFAEVTTFANHWGFTAVDNGDGTITTSGPICNGTNLAAGAWLIPNRANAQTEAAVQNQFQELSTDGPFEYTITEEATNPMTGYVRKSTTFEELHLTTSTTPQEVRTFFGEPYDANRFALSFVGRDEAANFILVLNGREIPGDGQEEVYTNPGGYLRAERRGDGKTVGIAWAPEALAADPLFQQA